MANLKKEKYKTSQIKKLTGGYPVEVFDYERCYNELVFPVVTGCYYNAEEIKIRLSLANKENSDGRISYTVQSKYGANPKIRKTIRDKKQMKLYNKNR